MSIIYDYILSTSEIFTSGVTEPIVNRGLYPDESTASNLAVYAYRNNLKDLIPDVPSSCQGQDSIDGYRVYKRENSLKAIIYGTEAEMEYSLSSLITAYGNIIYTFGQNISKDEPMRRIPPLNGRFGFRYRDQKGIKASTDWIFALKQDRLSNGDIADDRIKEGGTPG